MHSGNAADQHKYTARHSQSCIKQTCSFETYGYMCCNLSGIFFSQQSMLEAESAPSPAEAETSPAADVGFHSCTIEQECEPWHLVHTGKTQGPFHSLSASC